MTSYGLNVQSRAAKNFGSMTARQMAALFFIFGLVAIFRRSKARTNPRISRGPRSWPMVAWLVPDIPRLSRMDGAAKCRGGWSTRRTAAAPFTTLAFHPEARATRTQWASAIRWSDKRDMVSFQTSSYPPPFYVPSAIGILIGRTDNMTVVQTLMLSRILTGTTAVMLTAIAIACAGSAAPWLFAVMTLPMSLSLMASSSQDALLFACNAFAGALMVKALRSPDARNGMTLACLGLCLGLIGMARPAYGALAVAPLGFDEGSMALAYHGCGDRWGMHGVVVAFVAANVLTNVGDFIGADPQAQWELIYHDPMRAWNVAWKTLIQHWPVYVASFIGQLGWFDTSLPAAYHKAALLALGAAALATMLGSSREPVIVAPRLVILFCLVLSAAGIFGLVYISWTVPGYPTVEGVQGRYFTPLALAGVALLPGISRLEWRWTH